MTMPPLPEAVDVAPFNHMRVYAYTADQMRAYGAACAAAYKADAERYRWLRATTNFVTSNGERIDVRNNPELWDSTIDACIQKRARGEAP